MVTVIVASFGPNIPEHPAVIFPFWSTLATDSSFDFQVTFLFVAFCGKTITLNLSVLCSTISKSFSIILTPVTGIVCCFFFPQLVNTIGAIALVDNTPIVENNIDLINFDFIFYPLIK